MKKLKSTPEQCLEKKMCGKSFDWWSNAAERLSKQDMRPIHGSKGLTKYIGPPKGIEVRDFI